MSRRQISPANELEEKLRLKDRLAVIDAIFYQISDGFKHNKRFLMQINDENGDEIYKKDFIKGASLDEAELAALDRDLAEHISKKILNFFSGEFKIDDIFPILGISDFEFDWALKYANIGPLSIFEFADDELLQILCRENPRIAKEKGFEIRPTAFPKESEIFTVSDRVVGR